MTRSRTMAPTSLKISEMPMDLHAALAVTQLFQQRPHDIFPTNNTPFSSFFEILPWEEAWTHKPLVLITCNVSGPENNYYTKVTAWKVNNYTNWSCSDIHLQKKHKPGDETPCSPCHPTPPHPPPRGIFRKQMSPIG